MPDTESSRSAATANLAESDSTGALDDLLQPSLKVINAGLEGFAQELQAAGIDVVQIDWRPPAGGDAKLAALLSKLGS